MSGMERVKAVDKRWITSPVKTGAYIRIAQTAKQRMENKGGGDRPDRTETHLSVQQRILGARASFLAVSSTQRTLHHLQDKDPTRMT